MNITSLDINWFSGNRGLMRKGTEAALIGSHRAIGQVLGGAGAAHQNESERGAVNRSGETSVMSLGSPRQMGGGVRSPSKWHHLVLAESSALALTWSLTLEGRSNTAILHCGTH